MKESVWVGHLQAWVSVLREHAGFISGSGDADGEGGEEDEDSWSCEAVDPHSFVHTGLIQNAWHLSLPFLGTALCWSAWNMSSLVLLLRKRSFCNSLSTRWMMHSRLLSTFTHTFSWVPDNSTEDIWFISLSDKGKSILITAAALIAQLQ